MEPGRNFVACPVCKDTGFASGFSKEGLDFVLCRGCGLVYINPQPTDNEIKALYSEDYYRPWGLNTDSPAVEEMKMATFDDKLAVVERFINKGRVLDIGCATGFFLEAARRRGWEIFGVEISPYSASIAQERFGKDRVYNGPLEEAAYDPAYFDAVFMSDLIEHIKDLDSFLKEVHRITRIGGKIAVITPNIESFSHKLMRKEWPHFKMEHLYYFSPITIKRLLEKHGFKTLIMSDASKALNLRYIERHFSAYPVPIITPILKSLIKNLPKNVGNKRFTFHTGELFVIAERMP